MAQKGEQSFSYQESSEIFQKDDEINKKTIEMWHLLDKAWCSVKLKKADLQFMENAANSLRRKLMPRLDDESEISLKMNEYKKKLADNRDFLDDMRSRKKHFLLLDEYLDLLTITMGVVGLYPEQDGSEILAFSKHEDNLGEK